jgi:hypothetical protein
VDRGLETRRADEGLSGEGSHSDTFGVDTRAGHKSVGLRSHHANRPILIEGDPLPVRLRRSQAIKARKMTRPAADRSGIAVPQISQSGRWISGTARRHRRRAGRHRRRDQPQPYAPARPGPRTTRLARSQVPAVGPRLGNRRLASPARRPAHRRSGWLPWAAPATGSAGSIAANVATAGPDIVSRLIAG